ncbi:MAG: polyprenyl synthetase family protein [bacterium]|nr:polyprenyl synthetase family protein [bacterium]
MSTDRGLDSLARRLTDLAAFIGADLAALEDQIVQLPRYPHLVGRGASHLLDLGGKRLRPTCVVLAARLGAGCDARGLDLAVAAELAHTATLLHDDVVDLGETRRGAATARATYGNAVSIFAGDWVLIEALRRVGRCGLPGLLDDLLETIEEMILAESLQLENRGRINTDRDAYFRVIEGKTASLFRWAMLAGGMAGGLDPAQCRALQSYGIHLGIAFQAIDDLLDFAGKTAFTGKELFADLREGKMTYPVILALERDPDLRPVLEEVVTTPVNHALPEKAAMRVIASLSETRALDDCLALARERSARAVASLDCLPPSRAACALATVAEAIVDRDL